MGNSVGRIALLCLLVACKHNVGQDEHTGPDGKLEGAKALTFENNQAKAKGIVTYPGGDRTDWKQIEVPDKKVGIMDVQLQWQSPRPGLQLAFDVFDQWHYPVAKSERAGRGKRIRSAEIKPAKGTYFVRVYAVDRGDAGAYKLTVDFKEIIPEKPFDWAAVNISGPPTLAEIPAVEPGCEVFDVKIKACANKCPDTGPPPGHPKWAACDGVCWKDDVDNKACWPTMKCPAIPNINVKDCAAPSHWPACDRKNPSTPTNIGNPKCLTPLPPALGRVMKNDISGTDLLITIAVTSEDPITRDWKIFMLSGDSDTPLIGGDVVFVRRSDAKTIVGRVHLTTDVLKSNERVKFVPPPRTFP